MPNNLDKQYTDLIGDAYMNYRMNVQEYDKLPNSNDVKSMKMILDSQGNSHPSSVPFNKEEFINKIKTDDEFAKKWGLKIVERELSSEERKEILYSKFRKEPIVVNGKSYIECAPTDINFEFFNIPTKLITITYNNETIESYE